MVAGEGKFPTRSDVTSNEQVCNLRERSGRHEAVEECRELRMAIERGVNFIDTALAYGDGHSEQLVGQVVRETSHKIYVASKVPPKNLLWPARPGVPISEVFPYEYIMESTERSLKNLDLETIDVQQLHVWNPEWIVRDEWKRAFEDLKRSGKAQAVGISINDHQPDSALEIIGIRRRHIVIVDPDRLAKEIRV